MNKMKVTFFFKNVFFCTKELLECFWQLSRMHRMLSSLSMIWSLLLPFSLTHTTSQTRTITHTHTQYLSQTLTHTHFFGQWMFSLHCSFSQSLRISDPKIQSCTLHQFFPLFRVLKNFSLIQSCLAYYLNFKRKIPELKLSKK